MNHNVHVLTSLAPVVQCVSVWSVEAFWSASASVGHGYESVGIEEEGEGEGEVGEGVREREREERIKNWFITHSLHH